jgi:uncharacterized protein (TIGR02246 family)
MNDENAVRAILDEYISACVAGSVERLQAIFHPDALMTGFLAGQHLMGTVAPFYDAVRNTPPPGSGYHAAVADIRVAGAVASATVTEQGYLGLDFVDLFHLVRKEDGWKIVSKTFNGVPPGQS